MQTVDMVDYLEKRGWASNAILMIDMDAGISGAKKIDERPGMSHLFDLITERQIGAVACQDEDRLFRDVTQIQVNIFIEACRANDVTVLTPSMVYQFADPTLYAFHARQFRFKCEMAAEYLNTVIRGKLASAKRRMFQNGQWAGATVSVGYIIDDRRYLADGSENPQWRRYVIFEPFAEIVREYYRLFLSFNGNLRATARYIQAHGPFYPEPGSFSLPVGFTTRNDIHQYGNGYCPSVTGLGDLLSNSNYIGYWTFKGVVVRTNNHLPLIPVETFMKAFNYLSKTTLDGSPNPYFKHIRENNQHDAEVRRKTPLPLCLGLIFSEYEGKWYQVGKEWAKRDASYRYVLRLNDQFSTQIWSRRAKHVDKRIVEMLYAKLSATFDQSVWMQSIDNSQSQLHDERRRIQKQLEFLERTMQNQIVSLDTITNADMIKAVQKRYEELQAERERLSEQLRLFENEQARLTAVSQLQQNWRVALKYWDTLKRDEKRNILFAFIDRIEALGTTEKGLTLTVFWRDNSSDTRN